MQAKIHEIHSSDLAADDRNDWPTDVNIHSVERKVSTGVGTALLTLAALRRGLTGAGLGLIGAALVQRGASGHCHLYSALRVSTAHGLRGPAASVPHGQGVKVKRSVLVNQAPQRVYNFWRQLENMPLFMHDIESVAVLDGGRSHWRARGPFGRSIEWTATTINEVEGERIAWRSLPGSQVHHAGSVRFEPAGQGTLVTVTMEFSPPAGMIGAMVGRLIGLDPEKRIEEDLRRLKLLLEADLEKPWTAEPASAMRPALVEENADDAANDELEDRRGVH